MSLLRVRLLLRAIWRMPGHLPQFCLLEINRVVVTHVSSFLTCSRQDSSRTLACYAASQLHTNGPFLFSYGPQLLFQQPEDFSYLSLADRTPHFRHIQSLHQRTPHLPPPPPPPPPPPHHHHHHHHHHHSHRPHHPHHPHPHHHQQLQIHGCESVERLKLMKRLLYLFGRA